eukprot:UN19091
MNVGIASGGRYSGDGLMGEFFLNRWLYGQRETVLLVPEINLNYGVDLVGPTTTYDYASARFEGWIRIDFTETYTFTLDVDR